MSALVKQPQAFELFGVEEVGFVEDHDDPAAPFVLFGGEGFLGLGDERGPVEARASRRGPRRSSSTTPGPDGGVAEVDDGVAAGVDAGQRGAHGHGLARAHLAGDHPDAPARRCTR